MYEIGKIIGQVLADTVTGVAVGAGLAGLGAVLKTLYNTLKTTRPFIRVANFIGKTISIPFKNSKLGLIVLKIKGKPSVKVDNDLLDFIDNATDSDLDKFSSILGVRGKGKVKGVKNLLDIPDPSLGKGNTGRTIDQAFPMKKQ